jgi:probable phosphoglycerate mutase
LNLYLTRHAETDYNAETKVQGRGIDSDINETGRLQAASLFAYYKHIEFSAIYTSSLKRTQQTILPFSEAKNINVYSSPGLDEISWGDLEGLLNTDEVKNEILIANRQWSEGNTNYAVPKGESPQQVWQRAKPVIDEITARFQGKNVLLCTHGRTLRIILSMLLGYGLENMQIFTHNNTGVNILKNASSIFWALKLNDISHLKQDFRYLSSKIK